MYKIFTNLSVVTERVNILHRQIKDIYLNEVSPKYTYHNYFHTSMVVDDTVFLADEIGVSTAEKELLVAAAWLHDVGYIQGAFGHEERSAKRAGATLEPLWNTSEIVVVQELIRSTRLPQTPSDIVASILCDADLSYLGKSLYGALAQQLVKEWKETGDLATPREYLQRQIDFLSAHQYHTDAARLAWCHQKGANLKGLKAEMVIY